MDFLVTSVCDFSDLTLTFNGHTLEAKFNEELHQQNQKLNTLKYIEI